MTGLDVDALIFDNDGVVVDSEIIHVAVERDYLSEIGLEYDHDTYLSRFVGLSMPDYYSALARDYFEKTGQPFPTEFGAELRARAWPRIERELQPLPGVETLAARFPNAVAVASSAPLDRVIRKLEIVDLHKVFSPHVYSAEQVENGKPAPDLFLMAADKIGVTAPHCAVIEDSVHGIRAATCAGMIAIGFDGGGHADKGLRARLLHAGAARVVSSHAEILSLLGSR